MAFHYSVALPLATASLPSFAFALKQGIAVYTGFQTREAVFRQLSALFFLSGAPRRQSELAGAETPAGRQGEARRRRADSRGYKNVIASGLYFCLCDFFVAKVVFFLNSPSVEGGLGKEQRRLLGFLL